MTNINETKNSSPKRDLTAIVLTAVALAMGVAVVVLSILGSSTADGLVSMLGIGLFALALNSLRNASQNTGG